MPHGSHTKPGKDAIVSESVTQVLLCPSGALPHSCNGGRTGALSLLLDRQSIGTALQHLLLLDVVWWPGWRVHARQRAHERGDATSAPQPSHTPRRPARGPEGRHALAH